MKTKHFLVLLLALFICAGCQKDEELAVVIEQQPASDATPTSDAEPDRVTVHDALEERINMIPDKSTNPAVSEQVPEGPQIPATLASQPYLNVALAAQRLPMDETENDGSGMLPEFAPKEEITIDTKVPKVPPISSGATGGVNDAAEAEEVSAGPGKTADQNEELSSGGG